MLLRVFVIALVLLSQEVFPQSVIQNILNKTNLDSLLQNIRDLSGINPVVVNGVSTTIVSRNKSNPSNAVAADYIKQRLTGYGIPAVIQSFSSTGGNIIGTQTGTRYPNKKYIICAHFDDMPSGTTAPGADDNGSGTAAVIEAARIFSQYSFPYTIVYALWDEEEQGLVGSAYYATQAASSGDSILGVINLDMIGYEANGDNVANIHTKTLGNCVAMANKMSELNTQFNIGISPVIKNPGITASDHASFWNKNYNAILLIEDDNNDFNAYYHTVNDKITAFNNPYFLKMSKLAFATLAYYAMNISFSLEHTPIASRTYNTGITTTARIISGNAVATGSAAPRLYYRLKTLSGTTNFSFVTGTPAGGENYSFSIPPIAEGSFVEYYLAAQDSAGQVSATLPTGGSGINPPGTTPPTNFYSFYTSTPLVVFADTINQISLWTVNGTWGTVTNKFVSAPYSVNESPAGLYGNSVTYTLTTANTVMLPVPVSAQVTYYLTYDVQWDIEDKYDYCQIQVSSDAGNTWTALQGMYTTPGTNNQPAGQPLYDGTQTSWVKESITLPFQYYGKYLLFRFYFKSDASLNFDGFYFDNFSIIGYYIVPVELTSFTAETVLGSNILRWETASELNNRDFLIERMNNGIWQQIGIVPGNGTSTQKHIYSYTDKITKEGSYTYRLVQRDFNGALHPSAPVTVNTLAAITEYVLYTNYPNPFNPATTIEYQLPADGDVSLKVFDVFGSEVCTLVQGKQEAGKHSVSFSGQNLSSGVYVYELRSGNTVLRKKMNLLK